MVVYEMFVFKVGVHEKSSRFTLCKAKFLILGVWRSQSPGQPFTLIFRRSYSGIENETIVNTTTDETFYCLGFVDGTWGYNWTKVKSSKQKVKTTWEVGN